VPLVLATAVAADIEVKAREVADQDIDRVIGETIRYLYARQSAKTGLWPWRHRGGAQEVPRGGPSALATFALLEAGRNPQEEALERALQALIKLKTDNLYVRAVRTMALSLAVTVTGRERSRYREPLKQDVAWLTRSAVRHGAWGYRGPERQGDNSCSQFALLALWEADRAGITVNPALIRRVEATWLARQRDDGGWIYVGQTGIEGKSTAPMTAAALASLYICRDATGLASGTYRHQDDLDRGWAFLVDRLSPDYIGNGYLAFCIQRVGLTTGRKFIGDMDWFEAGARVLCKPTPYGRRYRGPWGPGVRAAFELIFLARGRIPLTYNKLQHGREDDWNLHSRDLARFTEYMRRNYEQRMRWQIVDVTQSVQDMLDAPVLMISGIKPLDLTTDQWAKLREYSLRGGLLLFVPTKGSEAFVESAARGLRELYAEQRKLLGAHYALQPVPAGHPIYTARHKLRQGRTAAAMQGVSDGTRYIALICERDVAAGWQRFSRLEGKLDHQIGANLFYYATGGNPLHRRMRPVFVGTGTAVRHRVKVGWLKHGGGWYSQPHAVAYVSQKLTAENWAAIDLKVGVEINPAALGGYHLLWMTGTEAFTLADEQVRALRQYLSDGGMLFVNAVGGSLGFRRSAQEMLDAILAGGGLSEGLLGDRSPLVTGKAGDFRGPNLSKRPLRRTQAWRASVPRESGLKLQTYEKGGRIAIVFGPYGVHDTLDGHTAYGAMSYLPPVARDVAANVVLYALANSRRPARATTQPRDESD
jgi:hypothetical protein